MIGTRFYKKIDEKFLKLLLEKMKKDSKELLKAKLKDFDDYSKSKVVFIEENKEKWVKEAVEELMTGEEFNDENEEIAGFKRNALDEYLAQDKVVKLVFTKAQALEAAYRKL
jgi:wyosine [tRNA(Phe)-imidazoG37] synthetase (radical SAM superfamily)